MYVHGFGTHNDHYVEPAIDYTAPQPPHHLAPKPAPAPPPVYQRPLYKVPTPAPAPPPG